MDRSESGSNVLISDLSANVDVQMSAGTSTKFDDSSRKLKFGIDSILSPAYPSSNHSNLKSKPTLESSPFSASCYRNTVNYCYQFDNGVEASLNFYPSFYISSAQILPSIGRFTNFVIEADKTISNGGTSKRKRIWSRAVFSKLQRKGLEKRFQIQKYIMKPDRKQLAASLGLSDAQVKVWFQNRRMKWRNRKENLTNKNTANRTPE